jgi:hypothetical protein
VVPCCVDLDDDLEDLLDELRRQAHRRLVEEQQLRLGHQRAADGEHLLLAAGQRAAFWVLRSAAAGTARRRGRVSLGRSSLARALVGAHLEVLEHAHAGEDAAALGRLADAHLDDLVRRRHA